MDTFHKTNPSRAGNFRASGVPAGILARDRSNYRAAKLSFRRLFESAPDAMVLANAQGSIILVNDQTEQLFGYSRDELIGQQVEMLIPERFRATHLNRSSSDLREAYIQPVDLSVDLCGLKKDGSERSKIHGQRQTYCAHASAHYAPAGRIGVHGAV